MSNNVIIRESDVKDSNAVYNLLMVIAKLHKDARPDVFANLVSKYTPEQVSSRLSKSDNGVFVAEVEGNVVGYVFCDVIKEGDGKTLYVDDLCIDEAYRRLGIGKMLIDRAKSYAFEKNCRCVMLNVWEFNESAVRFYENYGFSTRSRHLEMKL